MRSMRSMRSMRGGFIFRNRGPSLKLHLCLMHTCLCTHSCCSLGAAQDTCGIPRLINIKSADMNKVVEEHSREHTSKLE
jgi:hypothetical protein